jgi:hypothetical protein
MKADSSFKQKVKTAGKGDFLKGGGKDTTGKQSVGTQKAGVTGKVNAGNAGGKFIKGGGKDTTGKQKVETQKSGVTGKAKTSGDKTGTFKGRRAMV